MGNHHPMAGEMAVNSNAANSTTPNNSPQTCFMT
jgi:hypothetical protein